MPTQTQTRSVKARSAAKARAQRQQNMLIGGLIIAGLLFVVVLLLLINRSNTATVAVSPGTYSQIPQTTTADGLPVIGNPDAKITLMEFADFSCPHCLEYHPTVNKVLTDYVAKGAARLIIAPQIFVGKDYSQTAALAALCAGKQNHFWEMYDALFNLQETRGYQSFNVDTLKTTADGLNMNSSDMLACMEHNDTLPALQGSIQLAQTMNIGGVPAVFYSTDGGKTFKSMQNSSGKDVSIPPYEMIGNAIEQANFAPAQ